MHVLSRLYLLDLALCAGESRMLLEEAESCARDMWRILYSLTTTTTRHSENETPTNRAAADNFFFAIIFVIKGYGSCKKNVFHCWLKYFDTEMSLEECVYFVCNILSVCTGYFVHTAGIFWRNIMLTNKHDGAVVLPDAVLLDVVWVLGGGHEPAHLHHSHIAPQVEPQHVVSAGAQVSDGVRVHLVTNIQFGECENIVCKDLVLNIFVLYFYSSSPVYIRSLSSS